jgi:uncharacterized membrane protein YgcG
MHAGSDSPSAKTGEDSEGAARRTPAGLIASLEAGLMVAAAVGLVYVIGGAVMWLRFRQAHLPADQAVALLPKTDLLVAGLRVMILPAVASAVLLVLLADWQNARLNRLESEQRKVAKQLDELPSESEQRAVLEARLRQLVERERRLWSSAHARRRRFFLGLACGVALVFAFVLPFSPGAFVWPVVVLAIVVYWQRLWSTSREEGEARPKPSLLRIAAVAMIASAVVSVARQLDPTAQLPSVAVYLSPAVRSVAAGDVPSALAPVRRGGPIRGILITATEDTVAVGDPTARAIGTYPRSSVVAMSIGPPLVPRTPSASLMSMLLFRDAWAWTPLKLWCEGDGYGWSRLGSACRGRPRVEDGPLSATAGAVVGIRVTCPVEAEDSCRGFVRLKTVSPQFDPEHGRLTRFVLSQAKFNVLAGRSADLQLPFDRKWESTFLGRRKTIDLPVRVTLTRDALGDQVVFDDRDGEGRRMLTITRSERERGDEKKKKKAKKHAAKKKKKAGETSNGNGSSGEGSSGGGSSGGGSSGGGSSGGDETGAGTEDTAPAAPSPSAELVPPPTSDEETTAPPAVTPTP